MEVSCMMKYFNEHQIKVKYQDAVQESQDQSSLKQWMQLDYATGKRNMVICVKQLMWIIRPVNDKEPFAEEFKEFKSDEHASKDVWTKQFKPRSSSKDVWIKQFRPHPMAEEIFLHLILQIEMNRDPSLLRTVTDWKGKPSLRSTEVRSLLHDNIVPKPDLALELGKSISLTEAEEEAVAREVHATHARIKRSSNSSKKLKGIQTLTPAEQEAADIMKALKESKKMSKR
ncbi:hypothetical protein Tco_0455905 [Tanacetum coccineum]